MRGDVRYVIREWYAPRGMRHFPCPEEGVVPKASPPPSSSPPLDDCSRSRGSSDSDSRPPRSNTAPTRPFRPTQLRAIFLICARITVETPLLLVVVAALLFELG